MSENQTGGILAGFAIGAVVGAGIALLLAPASGVDTRRRIKSQVQDLGDKARDLGETARGKLDEVGQRASDLTHAVKEGRDAFQAAAADGRK